MENKTYPILEAEGGDEWLIMGDRRYTTGTGGLVQLPVDGVEGR